MIKEKIYYLIEIETNSPLSIGNGIDDLTDSDLLKDADGNPFIPATALAGVMLHYLNEDEQKIFTPKINTEGRDINIISPYFISDATLIKSTGTSIRDGIKLDENKITIKGNKYNVEILEAGSVFTFRIEITVRDNDDSEKMKEIIYKLLANINDGNILVGAKTSRGFGRIKINNIYEKEFNQENLPELVKFNKFNKDEYIKKEINYSNTDDIYDTITVNLKQLGGLNIRSYSARKGDVDYRSILSNGIPVVPGTSWSGLIRRQANYYNSEMYKQGFDQCNLDDWFGYVHESAGRDIPSAKASSIIVEESKIKNAKQFRLTRNKIDRFSGGSSDSALYSEEIVFNGNTNLTVKIKKNLDGKNDDYILGLLALTIKDIANGLIAVGGQTSIGRGIFKVTGITKNGMEIAYDNSMKTEEITESLDDMIARIYECAKEGKEENE